MVRTAHSVFRSMPWGAWLCNLVFLRWGQEALYIIQVLCLDRDF